MELPRKNVLPVAGILFGLVALAAVVWVVWRSFVPSPLPSPPPVAAPVVPEEHLGVLPFPGGPEGYAGSDSCRSCHEKQHVSWHRSYHRTMTQALSRETVLADFSGVDLDFNGERFHLSETNGAYWVTIGAIPSVAGSAPVRGDLVRLRLALMTGSHHMQVFWLPGGRGNLQIGFPFTWLIEDQRWVPRPDTFIRDPDAAPVMEVWNQVCIRCHTTGGIPKPYKEAGIFASEVTELGISCEACHGPGEEHVALRKREALRGISLEPEADPIVQPADLPANRSAQICGNCHSMKWFDKSEGWQTHGFRFRPGDDLNETTPVIRASRLEEQPWLASILEKHPRLLEDFFWSDGMIRVAGREYNGLVESACHTAGSLSCLSCHSMHNSDPDDQLARNRSGNQACAPCHQNIAQSLPTHTRHAEHSAGSLCYNCHMPHTTYGVLKAIRSHEIDSPNTATEKATGRPNACNLCHANQTLAWTAGHLETWFGQKPPALSAEDREMPSLPRHLLAGDAGQRALAAWNLGWSASQEASGKDWQAAVLARALNDRYSAVRYIAGKSLAHFPGFDDFEYDFVAPAGKRAQAVAEAAKRWKATLPDPITANPDIEFFDERGRPRDTVIQQLLSNQNQRPIRLRE